MPYTIAVAGKGGVGKTTLTGMMIQRLAEQKKGPILAVDADANSNLNEVLGVEVEMTLGDIRDELSNAELSNESPIPKGMSKQDYTEFKFDSALVEEDDVSDGTYTGKRMLLFCKWSVICPGCQTCPELQLCGRGQRSRNGTYQQRYPSRC